MAAPPTITRTSGASNARFAAVALLSLGAVLLGASNLSAPTNLSASNLSTDGTMPAAEVSVANHAVAHEGPCKDACPLGHAECVACVPLCEQDVLGQACTDCQASFPSNSPCHVCFACVASHNHDHQKKMAAHAHPRTIASSTVPTSLFATVVDQNAAWQAGAHLRAATSANAMEEEFEMVTAGKCAE